jgi:hypothetical protein
MKIFLLVAALALEPMDQTRVATEKPRGITVDFVAVLADGTPVPDLKPAEVEIRIGDRLRTIRSLRRVTAGPALAPRASRLAPPYGTNENVVSGRRFVLIVDQESFRTGTEPLLRGAVEGLVAQLTPLDVTMLAALPFGGVRVPFTSDGARIRRGIEGVTGQGSRGETGSDLACRTRRFLETLETFLPEHAAGTQPTTVVVFTAGLAAPRRDAPAAMAPGICELAPDQFRRLTAAVTGARANVYVLVPADVGMNAGLSRESIAGGGFRGSDNPLEGIEYFEGATGARRLPLDATGTASLLRVSKESSSYYEAELEPERDESFGRSRSFSVKALRRDVTVRARPEITLRDAVRLPAGTKLTVPDLLGSLEPVTDLPLRIGGFTVRESADRHRVGVVVETVDPAVTLASVGAILIADGRVVGRWFAKDASERPLLGAIGAPAGTYTLRVAALDTAGRPGVAEEAIDVALTSVGPLSLGSLMLGVSRPEGMRPQLEFGSEPTAIASFDIYGGGAGMELTAALEVARDPEGPPLATVPLALKRADESRVVATGAVPLGALAPGDYVVRGVIRLADGTTGRVTRTLRKTR